VQVSPGVIAGNIASVVNPVYPPEAKVLHVQGMVVLHALISKTGDIEDLQVVSGPELLRQAAIDAVSRWKYKPYTLNGEPTAVQTTINVNFTFAKAPKDAAPPPPNAEPGATGDPAPASVALHGPVRVSSGTMAGLRISQVNPVFPAGVNASGVVVLHAIISKTGTVEDLRLLSGAADTARYVMDAVRQWAYEPYLVNSEPVEVQTTVAMSFSQSGGVDITGRGAYAELTDKELFDQGAEAIKNDNGDLGEVMLQALLDRYSSQDQKQVRKLPDKTQNLLQQASARIAMMQSSEQYYQDTGIRLAQIGKGVTSPVVIHQVDPEFSAEAKKQGFNGTVLVNFILDERGLPQNVRVLRGVGMGLDEKAVAAVKQYKFKPAMEDGKPVPMMLNVEINFRSF
jgi:TonB family protein